MLSYSYALGTHAQTLIDIFWKTNAMKPFNLFPLQNWNNEPENIMTEIQSKFPQVINFLTSFRNYLSLFKLPMTIFLGIRPTLNRYYVLRSYQIGTERLNEFKMKKTWNNLRITSISTLLFIFTHLTTHINYHHPFHSRSDYFQEEDKTKPIK